MAAFSLSKLYKISCRIPQIWTSRCVHGIVGGGNPPVPHAPSTWVQYSLSTDSRSPQPPKRPLNPWLLFCAEKRQHIVSQNPNASVAEVLQQAAQMYKDLSSTQKQQYVSEYEKTVEDYKKRRSAYMNSLTDEQKQQIIQDKQQRLKKSATRRLKKKISSLDKPKAEVFSGYLIYAQERSKNRGNTPVTLFMKTLGKEWKEMSDAVKQPYLRQASDARERNEQRLSQWEKQMINDGHLDVIRKSQLPKVVSTKKPKQTKKNPTKTSTSKTASKGKSKK